LTNIKAGETKLTESHVLIKGNIILERGALCHLPYQAFPISNVLIPKVLIVNDDAASLLALATVLSRAASGREYEIVTARSGEEALREVLNQEFAVILLDVSMPIMDGFDTAEAIHSHPRSASIPIIFITAYFADEINRLKGYQAGAVDYLFTPVIPQILQAKVAAFVEMAKKNLELQEKTRQLEVLNQDLKIQRVQDLERINATLEAEIIERRLAEQRAHELATRDALTKLPNRRSLIERLDHAIAHAARHGEELALLFLDLDKFKTINDTLGHEVGDALLIQVAGRLSAAVRESDVVARLGGDEFVVLLEKVADANDAALVAKKIVQSIALPYDLDAHNVRSSTSIGISLYPRDGDSGQLLLKSADLAMYHAKQNQRGSVQFFHEELNAKVVERVRFEQELQQAIAREEFDLYYQPKFEIASGRMVGIEALLRWRHPRLGLLPAEEFISVAADYRLSVPIGEWVLGEACAQLKRWLDSGLALKHVPLAVNLSIQQLQPELPIMIQRILRENTVPPSLVQLEIAESDLIRNFDKASSVLRDVSGLGVTVAIDDFGTGYSSLSLLKTLPIGILKIDQSFIRDLGDDPGDTAIVGAVISTARALSMRVVAEGVETVTELAALTALGCDEYQGHLSCEPMPAGLLIPRLIDRGWLARVPVLPDMT
jgi:diguanylate cyclase (GGDEF)-like protein